MFVFVGLGAMCPDYSTMGIAAASSIVLGIVTFVLLSFVFYPKQKP
jgi:hypothetical protein